MDLLKILAYVVILVVVVAVGHAITSDFFVAPASQESTWLESPHYKLSKPSCPATNTSDALAYRVRILNDVSVGDLTAVNLSDLNVTEYLINVSELATLAAIPLSTFLPGKPHNTAYELHPLPTSPGDTQRVANKTLYICTPEKSLIPVFEVRNSSSSYTADSTTRYLLGNETVLLNATVITPPPYAELVNVSISSEVLATTLVVGYARSFNTSYTPLSNVSEGPYCYSSSNATYCYTYVHEVYEVVYRYELGYSVNNSATYGRSVNTSRVVVAGESYYQESDSEGYYLGLGPLSEIELLIDFSSSKLEGYDNTTNTWYYTYVYRISGAKLFTHVRGLKIPTRVNTSVTYEGLRPVTGFTPSVASIPSVILGPREDSRTYVFFMDYLDACLTANYGGREVRRCVSEVLGYKLLRVSIAGYADLTYNFRNFTWSWGSVAEVPYEVVMSLKLYEEPVAPALNITKLSYEVIEESVLKSVSSLLHTYASEISENYTEFQFWSLATQVPAEMSVCGDHNQSLTPLLNALIDGCGSSLEKALILSRILNYSGLESVVKEVVVRMPKGLEILNVSAEAVFTVINTYPQFYNLTSVGCAAEVKGGYLVAYDTTQNTVFSDLRKLADHP